MLKLRISTVRLGAVFSAATALFLASPTSASAERLISATIGLNYVGQGHCIVVNGGMAPADVTTAIVAAATGAVLAGGALATIPPGTSLTLPYQALTANLQNTFCEVTITTPGAEIRMVFKRVNFNGTMSDFSDGLPGAGPGIPGNANTSDPGEPGPKTIFVTSSEHTGNLGGLAGADAICQGLADSPSSIVPEGEYVALLSTSNVHAASRLTPQSGPFLRPDGVPVATDFAALFGTRGDVNNRIESRDLINEPDIDETGTEFADQLTWTATRASGVFRGFSCEDWTSDSNAENGGQGLDNQLGTEWLNNEDFDPCGDENPFYCVQR